MSSQFNIRARDECDITIIMTKIMLSVLWDYCKNVLKTIKKNGLHFCLQTNYFIKLYTLNTINKISSTMHCLHKHIHKVIKISLI